MAINSGKAWTSEEESILVSIWSDSFDKKKCADKLGRSMLAVTCRLQKLGWITGDAHETAANNKDLVALEHSFQDLIHEYRDIFPKGTFTFDEEGNFSGNGLGTLTDTHSLDAVGYIKTPRDLKYDSAFEQEKMKAASKEPYSKTLEVNFINSFESKLDTNKLIKKENKMGTITEKRTYVLNRCIEDCSEPELLNLLKELSEVENNTMWVDGVSSKYADHIGAQVSKARQRVNKALEAKIA